MAPQADFRSIYDVWFEDVLRWIRALRGSDADREDIAQEVFLVVKRRLAAFDGADLVAHAAAWDFGQHFGGVALPMAGISGVAGDHLHPVGGELEAHQVLAHARQARFVAVDRDEFDVRELRDMRGLSAWGGARIEHALSR